MITDVEKFVIYKNLMCRNFLNTKIGGYYETYPRSFCTTSKQFKVYNTALPQSINIKARKKRK